MNKKLPEKLNCGAFFPEYEKLIMLKKALQVPEDEEVSEKILLDTARNHNLEEIYLIAYLVDTIENAPKEIKAQNERLISFYNYPEKYAKVFKETAKLYRTHPKFKKYAAKRFSDLDLMFSRNCAVINLTIYGLCPKLITKTVYLDHRNVLMNFHILQKWLSEQRRINFDLLTDIEQKIVLYLANGYSSNDIINEKLLGDDAIEEERLKTILYELLPARCNVQSVCQVMAVMFLSNPDLVDIEKAMQLLDDLFKKGDF